MPREFRHAIDDMLAAIQGAERAVSGKTIDDYRADWILKHAIERAVEIISEASRALPADVTATQPQINWRAVRAIGNVLRHEYHSLSDPILWNVVIDEFPRLKTALQAIMEQFPER
ncbi:hypothetical protein ANRL2_00553 [Anaerolineae bacterium]|nr:hypothetical protein ANRL2_00553 [Anaerolineae bacterium]